MPVDTKITSSRPSSLVTTGPGIEHAKVGRTQSDLTHTRQHDVLKSRSGASGTQSMRPRQESRRLNELKPPSQGSSKTNEQEMSFLPPGGSRSDRHEFDDAATTSGGSFHEKEIVEEDKKPHGNGNHGSTSDAIVKIGGNPKSEIEKEEPDPVRRPEDDGAGGPNSSHHSSSSSSASSSASAQGRWARAVGMAKNAGKSLDIYQQITSRDDAAVLEMMRATPAAGHGHDVEAQTHESHVTMSVPAMQQAIVELERAFMDALREDPSHEAEGSANSAKKLHQLTSQQLGDIKTQLHDLMVDQSLTNRAAGPIFANLMGAAMGIAVPVLIKDAEYTALNTGFFAQTMVKLAGQIRTPTSGSSALMNRQLRDRIAIPVLDAAAWLPTALKSLEKVGKGNSWMGGAAAFSAVAMAGLFFGKEINEKRNKLLHGHPAPSLQSLGQSLSEPTLHAIAAFRNGLLVQGESASHAAHAFEEHGLELSDTLAAQVGLLSESIMGMANDLGHLLPEDDGASGSAHQEVQVADHSADRGKKMALVVVTGLIGALSTAVMIPSKAGMADMAVDGAFNLAYMTKMALSKHEDYGHARAELQAFVGLNLMVILVMGANKIAGFAGLESGGAGHGLAPSPAPAGGGEPGFINAEPLNNAMTALAMAALCMTLTGPASSLAIAGTEGLKTGIGKGAEAVKEGIDMGRQTVGDGITATKEFLGRMSENMGGFHPAAIMQSLHDMSGADMINFAQNLAANAINALSRFAAGASPEPQTPTHNVTLTELD